MADTVPSAAQMKQALGGRPPRQKKKPNVRLGSFPPVANTDQTAGHSPFLHVMGVLQAVGVITGPADDTDQTTGQPSKKGKAPRTTGQPSKKGKAPRTTGQSSKKAPRTTGKSSKKAPRTTKKSSFLNAMAAAAPAAAPAADTPQPTGQLSREDKEAKTKSHISADAPTFQGGKGYSGGNPNSSVNPMRVIEVKTNEDGCAMYLPNERYGGIIQTFLDTVETQGRNIEKDGIVHPYLGFRKATINEKVWKELANKILPNSGDDTKRARQFRSIVCYLGISSHSRSGLFEWTFDPERWNREGYRITRGGDVKGGKPQVDFKP